MTNDKASCAISMVEYLWKRGRIHQAARLHGPCPSALAEGGRDQEPVTRMTTTQSSTILPFATPRHPLPAA